MLYFEIKKKEAPSFMAVSIHVDNGTWTDFTATTDQYWRFEGIETCGNVVIVELPENSKLQGYSDVESAYNGCNTDNTVSRDFKIFVR